MVSSPQTSYSSAAFDDALLCLTHIASQMSYRWLPEPVLTPIDGVDLQQVLPPQVDFRDYDVETWRKLLQWIYAERSELAPWLIPYACTQPGIIERLAENIVAHLNQVTRSGGLYIPITSPAYPPMLRDINDPPLAISVLGDASLLKSDLLSVVGSRKTSGFSLLQSFELGRDLALAGYTVVSGGAFGCDIAAHQGVLASHVNPAPAVVVFAGGLNELYPRGNVQVFRALAGQRAVFISERLWQATCRPVDFVARNRIIAGLSPMTVVMQAAHKSGAMITARFALDQGRDVSVLLHPAGDIRATGGVRLIREGARSFLNSATFVDSLSDPNF